MSTRANEKVSEIKRTVFDNNLLNTNIRDLHTIEKVFLTVIQSAVKEILLFFPTVNSFWLIQESHGLIGLLTEAIHRYIEVKF